MKVKSRVIFKAIALSLCLLLGFEQSGFAQVASQLDITGHLAWLRPALTQDKFRPLHLRYLSYEPLSNNFRLLLDKGDFNSVIASHEQSEGRSNLKKGIASSPTAPRNDNLKEETQKLLKYFFIGLALPNDTFWVNLRPDAQDNIIDPNLAQTDIGRIMLEADLQLKKDTALATSPVTPEGRLYWTKLYKRAEELFGSEQITIPTLTRPWIVPAEIIIRETTDSAYVYKATLKVMLEQDYLKDSATYNFKDPRLKALNEYSSQLIRELIIPKLNKAINSSKCYAPLRQVYYSLILAQWFKARYPRPSLRTPEGGEAISNKINSRNLTNLTSQTSWSKTTYFQAYQKSFKDGEYNIKEPIYTPYGQSIRSYFSGGMRLGLDAAAIPAFGDKTVASSPIKLVAAKGEPETSSDLIERVVGGEVASSPAAAQEGASSPVGEPIPRRGFLKRVAIITGGAALGGGAIWMAAKQPEKLRQLFGPAPAEYPASLEYLESLFKKEGIKYIQGFYEAVREKRIEAHEAEGFLRKLLQDADLLWVREESIKVLIRLNMLTEAELDKLINSPMDTSIIPSIAIGLGQAGTKEAVAYLIEWSKGVIFTTARVAIAEGLGLAGTQKAVAHLIEWSTKGEEEHNLVMAAIAKGLGRAGTPEAVSRLIEWSRSETDWRARIGIAQGLGQAGRVGYLIEWGKEWSKNKDYDSYVGIAIAEGLGQAGTKEAVAYLIKWSEEWNRGKGEDCFVGDAIAEGLGRAGTPEAVNHLIKWMKSETDSRARSGIAQGLGQAGTKEAVAHLIEWSRKEGENTGLRQSIAEGLGQAGTKEAVDRLVEWSQSERDFSIKVFIALGLGQAATKETVNRLIEWGKSERIYSIANALYAACTSIELFRRETVSCSDAERKNMQYHLSHLTKNEIDPGLNYLNELFDDDVRLAEERTEIYFKAADGRPATLYLTLALSHEITSHTFPVAYRYFKKYLEDTYGSFDIFRYTSSKWRDVLLWEFLFTTIIFGKFEECLRDTRYSPEKLAEIILSAEKVESFIDKPALFANVITHIMAFKNGGLKDAFAARVISLAQGDQRFKILIKLMLDANIIEDARLAALVKDTILPKPHPVWRGPQEEWVEDGVVSVGIYWSTAKEGEKAHYAQFPDIFADGAKVDAFYAKFSGYKDVSSEPEYKEKLKASGAERILVKEFDQTNRKIEIYLYPNLTNIKESPHDITLSRGHSNEEGIGDYPGKDGTLRIGSFCRSINDSDNLIQKNPDSSIITITGTGRAVETNPVLYYLLEYLGQNDDSTWGSWQDVKEYIRPHIPQSIQKYNFPDDDISFIFAAALKKIGRQRGALFPVGDEGASSPVNAEADEQFIDLMVKAFKDILGDEDALGQEVFVTLKEAIRRALEVYGSPEKARKPVLTMIDEASYKTKEKIISYLEEQFHSTRYAPLIQEGSVSIYRLRRFLLDQIRVFRMTHPDTPEIIDVFVTGSFLYLSDDNNRLPVAVMNNPDLIGDMDIATIVVDEEAKDWVHNNTKSAPLWAYLREKIKEEGIGKRVEPIFVVSSHREEFAKTEAELTIDWISNDFGPTLDLEEFLEDRRNAGRQDPDITEVKEYLKLEYGLGDLKRYQHYRDRLIHSENPVLEAQAILLEIHRQRRLRNIFKEISRRRKEFITKIAERMLARISIEDEATSSSPAAADEAGASSAVDTSAQMAGVSGDVAQRRERIKEILQKQQAILAALPRVLELEKDFPGTVRVDERFGQLATQIREDEWAIDPARRIPVHVGDEWGRPEEDPVTRGLVEGPAKSLVAKIRRAGGQTHWSNAYGPFINGVSWSKEEDVLYFTPLTEADYFSEDFSSSAVEDDKKGTFIPAVQAIVDELIREFGDGESLRGLRMIELGYTGDGDGSAKRTPLEWLLERGVDIHGVGNGAPISANTHNEEYADYLAGGIPPNSQDALFSHLGLYLRYNRRTIDINAPASRDAFNNRNPFPEIARVLRPGGILILVVVEVNMVNDEKSQLPSDEELALLGMERVKRGYNVDSEHDKGARFVAVMRKKRVVGKEQMLPSAAPAAIGSSASFAPTSPAAAQEDGKGGIDFRSLPVVTQAVTNLSANINNAALLNLGSINLNAEWQAIESMAHSGMSPSAERLKEFIQASCSNGDINRNVTKIILCISAILRQEEERSISTNPTLRDILVVLESGMQSRELKEVFLGKI